VIERVFLRRQFQRREKHAADLLGHQLPAGLSGLLLYICRIGKRTPPQQNVVTIMLGICHSPANRFKDFGPA
jgi:hypothetical protein